jgi:hypothetical protein
MRLQEQGVQALNGTYGRLIDNSARLGNDTKKLQNTMRNAVGWGSVAEPSVHFEQVLAQAAKSNDANVRNMAANWTKALDKLKKQDMPAQWKADNKHPRKGRTPWDRAGAFEEDTTHLDDEIKSLGDYGQALTEANMLEQLSSKYRKHNMDLTGPEVAGLKERIHTLEEGKRVQQAMTAADEAANGPQRAYNASMDALSELLRRGKIDQAEFTRQVYLAEEAYKSATDPLYQMNKELERNAQLVGHFGKDLDVRQFIQQMEEAAKAQGRSIYQHVPAERRTITEQLWSPDRAV